MQNAEMARRLAAGTTLDVMKEGVEVRPGLYMLRRYVEGKDYCDGLHERWIWSIGRRAWSGKHEIYAATDARFENDMNFECLFAR